MIGMTDGVKPCAVWIGNQKAFLQFLHTDAGGRFRVDIRHNKDPEKSVAVVEIEESGRVVIKTADSLKLDSEKEIEVRSGGDINLIAGRNIHFKKA